MQLDIITFNNVNYPCRDVYIKGVGTINVSTEALAKALNPTDNWDAVTGEAEYIDNKVYFYVPSELIKAPLKVLQQFINENS